MPMSPSLSDPKPERSATPAAALPARSGLLARLLDREVATFLAVGGTAYVVDVAAFNWMRTVPMLGRVDPTVAKALAVALAMVVTYLGNRTLTWRHRGRRDGRVRELGLFVVLNLVGLVIAVATLAVSHDLLGLTSRLADNISANVIGLGLGTAFRFWSYRRLVFGDVLVGGISGLRGAG